MKRIDKNIEDPYFLYCFYSSIKDKKQKILNVYQNKHEAMDVFYGIIGNL